jgi:hypothetical protein
VDTNARAPCQHGERHDYICIITLTATFPKVCHH